MSDNGTVIYRPAVPADAPLIAEIERLCFSRPWSEGSILAEIEPEDALFLTAWENGTLCGYVSCRNFYGDCYIGNLAVLPACRRKGIAEALMREVIETQRGRGADFISLEVRVSNAPARRLYEKLGFSVAGERRGYYSDPPENAAVYTLFFT